MSQYATHGKTSHSPKSSCSGQIHHVTISQPTAVVRHVRPSFAKLYNRLSKPLAWVERDPSTTVANSLVRSRAGSGGCGTVTERNCWNNIRVRVQLSLAFLQFLFFNYESRRTPLRALRDFSTDAHLPLSIFAPSVIIGRAKLCSHGRLRAPCLQAQEYSR